MIGIKKVASASTLLLDKENFNGLSWDPACGEGNIPKAMIARDMGCFGSDVCDRGYGLPYIDFLKTYTRVNNVISNPPYGLLQQFVEHGLEISRDKVVVIAPLSFLESSKRQEFFTVNPLKKIYVSRKRISMPPGGTGIKARGGIKAYAWFVWDKTHSGPPTIDWV